MSQLFGLSLNDQENRISSCKHHSTNPSLNIVYRQLGDTVDACGKSLIVDCVTIHSI